MANDFRKRVKELGDHYKVPKKDGQSDVLWAGEIKKAAKQPNMTIEQLYDHAFKGGSKDVVQASPKHEVKSVQTVLSPTPPAPVNTAVKVEAPNYQFVLPAPVVTVGSQQATVLDRIQWVSTLVFVFGSGAMFGLLISGSKFAAKVLARGL